MFISTFANIDQGEQQLGFLRSVFPRFTPRPIMMTIQLVDKKWFIAVFHKGSLILHHIDNFFCEIRNNFENRFGNVLAEDLSPPGFFLKKEMSTYPSAGNFTKNCNFQPFARVYVSFFMDGGDKSSAKRFPKRFSCTVAKLDQKRYIIQKQ
jgi:hypothetical protein